MSRFGHRFLDYGSGKLGFQVVCDESYIEKVADKIDFKIINGKVSELVNGEGKPLGLVCDEHSNRKGFLWSIHPRARWGLDYTDKG